MVGNKVIFRNISVLTIAQGLSLAAGVATAALLARALGPDAYGVLGFGVACLSFLGVIVTLGTDTYGVREIARAHDQVCRVIGELVGLRLVLAIAAYGGFAIFVYLLDRTEIEKTVLLVQGCGVFIIALTLDYAFQGLERMGINGLRQITTAYLTLAGVAFLVRGPSDLIAAAGIVFCAGAAAVIAVVLFARSNLGSIPIAPPAVWRRIIAISAPMAVGSVAHTIFSNTDVVMLGMMRTNAEVGLYSASFRIMMVGLVPAGMVLTAFFPSLTASYKNGAQAMGQSFKGFATSVVVVGMPVSAGGALFAEEILAVLYGDQFVSAAPVLMLLMGSVFVWHIRTTFDTSLLAWNAERVQMKINLAAAGANVALNFALIPVFGIIGAASASLVSHVIALIFSAIMFRRKVGRIDTSPFVGALGCLLPAVSVALLLKVFVLSQFESRSSLVSLLIGASAFSLVYIFSFLVYRWRAGLNRVSSNQG